MSMNSNDTNKLMYKNALRNLPSTYRGLEYVANGSSKTAYAVINYTPKIGDEIHVKYMFDEQTTSSNYMCLLSAGNDTYQTILLGMPLTVDSSDTNGFYFKYFASGDVKNANTNNDVNTWGIIDIDDTGLLTSGSYTIQSTPEAEIDTVDAKLYLFSRASGTNPFVGKIAEFYITRGGEYKVFLVPCYRKSDDVAGFYDTVGEAFYPSLSTDGFIKGYEVSEYGAIAYETVEGDLVTFESERDKDIKSLVVDIEPVQDLHGYSNPWPAGGGVNIWDEEWEGGSISSSTGENVNNATTIRSKNYSPCSPDTSYYYVNGTGGTINLRFYDRDKAFLGVGSASAGTVFTTPADSEFIRFFINSSYGTTYNNDISINYPATVTTYSPYSNICPITGWTGCEVVRTGKNLLQLDDGKYTVQGAGVSIANGIITLSGIATGSGGRTRKLSEYITLKPGTYSISPFTSMPWVQCCVSKKSDNTFVADSKNTTFIISEDTEVYFGINILINNNYDGIIISPQLEMGDTITSYESYTGNTYPISWQIEAGTVYGGHIDVVSGELVVDKAMVTLDGSQDEAWSSAYADTYGGFRLTLSDANINGRPNAQLRSNLFAPAANRGAMVPIEYGKLCTYNNAEDNTYVFFTTSITDRAAWLTWLSNNPTQLVYPLATPLTYQLPPTEVKALFTNNIYANTGDVSVQYPKGVLENVGLFNLRRMILQNNDGLPPAYKRVEYIVGNHSASNIDTGVSGNNDNLRIQICFECGFHESYFSFFGNYNGNEVNGWRFMAYTNDTAFLVNANSRCGSSKSMSTHNDISWLNKKIFADITQPYRSFTMDGYERVDTRELTISETENNTNIAIGANRVTSGLADDSKLTKYYFARIYDNGVLIRDYVPCYRVSDNKAGFYDMVNNTFNPSQGSADFTLP